MVSTTSPNQVRPAQRKVRLFVVDESTGAPRANVVIKAWLARAIEETEVLSSVGVFQSDHSGYLSFWVDLSDHWTRAWVEALANPDLNVEVGGALLAEDSGPFTLLVPADLPTAAPNLFPAIVRADQVDREISPRSFASSGDLTLGAAGCERFLKSAVTERLFRFNRLTFAEGTGGTLRTPGANPSPGTSSVLPISAGSSGSILLGLGQRGIRYRFGYLFEYFVEWRPIGHALGEILYSLPLAPCETVKLAVVEWSRRDEATRAEATSVREELLHDQRRDRVIEETVDAAVREWQHGGSAMAGISLWGAVNIGGSYSLSEGRRDTHGDSVQRIADHLTQASSAVRSLYSTVIVQASQSERDVVETRAVTNHNHCHAMTVLYYEVLRHYQVRTSFDVAKSRDVIFLKLPMPAFTVASALGYRAFLEPALLEPRLLPMFEAAARLELDQYEVEAAPPTSSTTARRKVRSLSVEVTIGRASKTGGSNIDFVVERRGQAPVVQEISPGSESLFPHNVILRDVDVSSRDLYLEDLTRLGIRSNIAQGFESQSWSWFLDGVAVWYELEDGSRAELYRASGLDYLLSRAAPHYNVWFSGALSILAPDPATLPPPPPSASSPRDRDEGMARYLLSHLNLHNAYYWRVIWSSQDVGEYALLFDGQELSFNGSAVPLLDIIELRVVGVVGDYLAFPIKPRNESLLARPLESVEASTFVSLPTRGVFAEVKLSECNACEERDDTRFWNWAESPCPDQAPEITGVAPGSRVRSPEDLAPSAFPSPLVNIVNPSPAPDPSGLAAAMGLLGTANLFRDMSGRTEVAQLLEQLAEGQVSLEQARQAAQAIRNSAGATSAGTPGSSTSGPPTARQQLDQLNVLRNAQAHGEITPEQRQALAESYLADSVAKGSSDKEPGEPGSTEGEADPDTGYGAFLSYETIENFFELYTGSDFITWFNAHVARRRHWAGKAISTDPGVVERFASIWNNIPLVFDSDFINLTQFATLTAILINENDGFDTTSEGPRVSSLAYFFERRRIRENPDRYKVAYNTAGGNRSALACFGDPDFRRRHEGLGASSLAGTRDRRWAGAIYPRGAGWSDARDPAINGFIMEADFFKFRGRGFNQLTLRGNYKRLIEAILQYSGANEKILGYRDGWLTVLGSSSVDSAALERLAYYSSNADWDDLFDSSDLGFPLLALKTYYRARTGGTVNPLVIPDGPITSSAVVRGVRRAARAQGGADYEVRLYNRVRQIIDTFNRTRVEPEPM